LVETFWKFLSTNYKLRLFSTIVGEEMLTFILVGWDAGVLGGILLTTEFQTAMGVSLMLLMVSITLADRRLLLIILDAKR